VTNAALIGQSLKHRFYVSSKVTRLARHYRKEAGLSDEMSPVVWRLAIATKYQKTGAVSEPKLKARRKSKSPRSE